MTPETEPHRQVQIAHVLTMDVVEYSTLLITEQTRVMVELTRIVKETSRFCRAEALGKLVRIPTGDGMALVFFDDPQAPIECAMEIATAMKNHADIRLRMGIHSGPVNKVLDINDRSNVAGAGIDMAQRVMDCGDAGHILLSKRVADDLSPYPEWNPYLHDLGECEVKHGRKVSLVNFYTSELGNREPPKKCQTSQQKAVATASDDVLLRKSSLVAAASVLLALLLVAVLILFRHTAPETSGRETTKSEPVTAKSIAVLPFENLSQDPDNAYFADGIQEEILTRLSKIADLKVISRTSTQRYKSKPDNLPEIAKRLGVANILEGTVQKAIDQVRVNVQLINAQNDSHLWADKYDRKLTDIFAVESEVATKIADTLQAKLTGPAKQAIAARPTKNAEAHELYLRGRYFVEKRGAENLNKAIDYFNQAITRDPNYALAYAGLSDCYDLLPQWSAGTRAEYVPKAKAAAIKALQVDDSVAEAHTSLASALFSSDLNLRESTREFERAIELNPNNAFAHYSFGYTVLPALGEVDRAIAEVRRAVELDPFSVIINANLGYVYIVARRYSEAIAQLRKTVELDANFGTTHRNLGEALELSGQLQQSIAEYEKGYKFLNDDHALAYLAHAYALKGEREKALPLLAQMRELEQRGTVWSFGFAIVYIGLGDKNEAINWLERSYQNKEFAKLSLIKVEPMLDPLRGDPRFEKLANQVVPPK
jgi:TolB-like protein/Flp pilus assembly protein TadD/class 3 adenylate cyclase